MKMENPNPFKTSDLGLAAYLLYEGLEILKPIKTAIPGRFDIVFIDSDERAQLEKNFKSGDTQVDAREYAICIHQVGRLIRGGPYSG